MLSRKVVVIGEPGVGKTSLVRRLVHRAFQADYLSTMGVDIYAHEVATGDPRPGCEKVRLVIWDMQGELGLDVFRHVYFKGTAAGLIVADITRPASQQHMLALAAGFETHAPGRPYVHVVNKADLVPGEQTYDMHESLRQSRWPAIVTSAKSGTNVEHAFGQIATALVRHEP